MSYMVILKLFLAVIISALFSFYLVPLCIFIAKRLQFLDSPDGKIKRQSRAVPYLGGIAVFVGFVISLVLLLPFSSNLMPLALGAALLLFVGLVDDLVVLKPYQKLFGQFIAVLCFLKHGLYLKEAFFLRSLWAIPVSALWMLSVINAYNLVDVMDGLATTLAIWSCLAFGLVAMLSENIPVAIFLASFVGSLVGFFWYNKPNAQIYLGDAGSLFIGGVMANIPFLLSWGGSAQYGLIAPIFMLAVPLLEVWSLICIRSIKGIPFYHASPHHFSLYLARRGWSKWNVLVISGVFSLLFSIAGLMIVFNIEPILIFLFIFAVLLSWAVLIFRKPKVVWRFFVLLVAGDFRRSIAAPR